MAHRGILLLIGSLLAVACETAGSVKPVTDPMRRVEVPGLSVLPPRGDGWHVVVSSAQEGTAGTTLVRFAKTPSTLPPELRRMVYVGAFAQDLEKRHDTAEEFLHDVRRLFLGEARVGEMVTGRQRLVAFDAAPDGSLEATCVRYTRLTELRDPRMFSGSEMSVRTRGLFCVHPHWARYAINVFYTQMFASGEEPLDLDAEVEPFLRSPTFTPTQPVPLPR